MQKSPYVLGIRSVMAYPDQCNAQKAACRRILQISSPRIQVSGEPFGRPKNDKMAADNVEILCRSASLHRPRLNT